MCFDFPPERKAPKRKDKFNIIRFESENNGFERYFPKGLEMSGIWYDLIQIDSFKELIKTKLPLGKSRYGGTDLDGHKHKIIGIINNLD